MGNQETVDKPGFRLIYDQEQAEFVNLKLMPMLEGSVLEARPFSDELEPASSSETMLLYLSDFQLKQLLPGVEGRGFSLAVLPHPEAREFSAGYGIDRSLDKALTHIMSDPESITADILYCNDVPVFNSVIVGRTIALAGEDVPGRSGMTRFFMRMKRLFNIKPFRVDIETAGDKKLKTAAAGIVISEHRKSSLLSRLMLDDSSISDGKMHAFLIMPRSLIELFVCAFRYSGIKKKLPPFAAHIKTGRLKLTFPSGARDFSLDRVVNNAQEIELEVRKGVIRIVPGAFLEVPEAGTDSGEVFKTAALPAGEAALELSMNRLPFIRHASSDEFKDLFQTLRENARISGSYLALMALSTMLATFGLFADSTPVVIGAMILAPLMAPIISLSMGTLRQDRRLISGGLKTIAVGLVFSAVFSVIITWLTPIQYAGSEIMARTSPNLFDLGIAVVSGVAGAYAHAREEIAKSLAGVAIAVALIPPFCVSAIGLAWGDWSIFFGALLLLTTNLAGITLAASFTFMFLGFSPFKLANRGMLVSIILVAALCVPLALGFNQMVEERRIVKQLEGLRTETGTIRDVRVTRMHPTEISIKIVSGSSVADSEITAIKEQIRERLNRDFLLEVVTAVSR